MNNNKSPSKKNNRTVKPRPKKVSAGGWVAIGLRNDFYHDGYRKMIAVMVIGITCLIISIGLTYYAIQKKEQNVYFATDANGALIPLIPLSKPNHSDAIIANWLSMALVDTFDFHFGNLERRLNESALKWFTSNGATELINALEDSNNFESIRNKQMFVQLSLKHSPIMLKNGKPDWSKYFLWKFQAEGLMTYRTTGEEFTNNVIFTIVVSRRSMLEDPTGLGIAKIIMTNK